VVIVLYSTFSRKANSTLTHHARNDEQKDGPEGRP
jgi:hypothetical protein